MKFKNTYLLVLILSFTLLGCKKEVMEIPNSNEPIFKVEGEFNGSDFQLIAGDNGAYMHTLTCDENGVNVFSGKLTGNDMSIEVGVYDGDLDMLLDDFSSIEPVFASNHVEPLTILSKQFFDNVQNISTINWYINSELAGVNEVSIYSPGVYDVCANIHFSDGTESTVCNELILGYKSNANCSISTSILPNGIISCSPQDITFPIEKIKWFKDGTFYSESMEWEESIGVDSKVITAEVYFQNGVVKRKSFLVNGFYSDFLIEDFTMFETYNTNFIPQDYNVRVKVKKGSDEYSSVYAQNDSSVVNISAVDYYGVNASGNDVYKLTGTVECNLKKESSTSLASLKMELIFGIEVSQ